MALQGKISYRYRENIDYTLENISFNVIDKSRIGLVGDNGAGKSTLIKLITGDLKPEGVIRSDYFIAVLSQEIEKDWVRGLEKVYINHRELLILREGIEDFNGDDLDIFTKYQELGGWELEAKIDKWLNRFNLSYSDLKRDVNELSGGELTKISLIALLIEDPEMFIFDEPTNHLDQESLSWMENFLESLNKPYIVVSHDREFLDRVTNETWEIKDGNLEVFSGNYSYYKESIENRYKRELHEYQEQTKKINKLNSTLEKRKGWAHSIESETRGEGYSPKYEELLNTSRHAMKRAKSIEKRITMMIDKEEKKRPVLKYPPRIEFNRQVRSIGKSPLSCNDLTKKFQKELFNNLSLTLKHGERLSLAGRNGSGKTTLLRCLVGVEKPDSGRVYIPEGLKVAYYAQDYENLDFAKTILDEVTGGYLYNESNIRRSLASIGFKGERVFEKISSLSPGEVSKVALIKAMLSESDLLVLDEPTNHLEIRTREVIEDALLKFSGSIIFVSHDRRFSDKISTREVNIEEFHS